VVISFETDIAPEDHNNIMELTDSVPISDLAAPFLSQVRAPTLLIVGERDERDPIVIDMNKAAYDRISSQKDLVIVPGATHLFEEPGTLEEVAELATRWFVRYLRE